MAWFGISEKMGLDCDFQTQDGIVSGNCKRTIKQKDGSMITDGQNVNMVSDPNNDCNVAYSGHLSVLDDDGFNTFDKIAKRMQKSCKRNVQKGLVSPKTQ